MKKLPWEFQESTSCTPEQSNTALDVDDVQHETLSYEGIQCQKDAAPPIGPVTVQESLTGNDDAALSTERDILPKSPDEVEEGDVMHRYGLRSPGVVVPLMHESSLVRFADLSIKTDCARSLGLADIKCRTIETTFSKITHPENPYGVMSQIHLGNQLNLQIAEDLPSLQNMRPVPWRRARRITLNGSIRLVERIEVNDMGDGLLPYQMPQSIRRGCSQGLGDNASPSADCSHPAGIKMILPNHIFRCLLQRWRVWLFETIP